MPWPARADRRVRAAEEGSGEARSVPCPAGESDAAPSAGGSRRSGTAGGALGEGARVAGEGPWAPPGGPWTGSRRADQQARPSPMPRYAGDLRACPARAERGGGGGPSRTVPLACRRAVRPGARAAGSARRRPCDRRRWFPRTSRAQASSAVVSRDSADFSSRSASVAASITPSVTRASASPGRRRSWRTSAWRSEAWPPRAFQSRCSPCADETPPSSHRSFARVWSVVIWRSSRPLDR